MYFPHHDLYWKNTADFLLSRFGPKARILAPPEFHEIFYGSYPYNWKPSLPLDEFDALVLHKGAISEIGPVVCAAAVDRGKPLFGNDVFVVFALRGRKPWLVPGKRHFRDFYERVKAPDTFKLDPSKEHSEFATPSTVVLMTTYNRPARLENALESIVQLGVPILIVNDGSRAEFAEAYAEVYTRHPVRVLTLPDNRGLPTALNAGLSYWLADPKVEWISYLQDDMEVRADLLDVLRLVQDPVKRPLLSGRVNPLHKIYGEETINGERVVLQRMLPGLHLHAHRDYWLSMLPIPSPYFQCPKTWVGRPHRGADEDWWISLWSPNSVCKRGSYVHVLPDLVRTTTVLAVDSTWGNPGQPEPPLPPPRFTKPRVPTAMAKPDHVLPVSVALPIQSSNFWEQLAHKVGQKIEFEIHSHVAAERAELYHAVDDGSTELEVLNFLNALVCLFKPEHALETGCYMGFGTAAITSGLESNQRGKLLSIELNPSYADMARAHLQLLNPILLERVEFITRSSLDFLTAYSGPAFDFIFLDTELDIRIREFQIIHERGLLNSGAVCVIHDTSAHRIPTAENRKDGANDFRDREILSALGPDFEVMEFPYSRGFHLMRYRGKAKA